MVQKCDLAQKLVLVISILFCSHLVILILDFDVNLVFPQLLHEQIKDIIANSKQEERNDTRHQNDHQLPCENESEVRFGQMAIYMCLYLVKWTLLSSDLREACLNQYR